MRRATSSRQMELSGDVRLCTRLLVRERLMVSHREETPMTTLIVCVSVSHGNTRKVADAIGRALESDVVEPEQVAPIDAAGYDVLGLGSGIYGMTYHPRLWRFARSLPRVSDRPVFLFATSGGHELWWSPAVFLLGRLLRAKGYRVVGTFACRGLDTWLPLRIVGGINKERPGDADLAAARAFAAEVDGRVGGAARKRDLRVEPDPVRARGRHRREPGARSPGPSGTDVPVRR